LKFKGLESSATEALEWRYGWKRVLSILLIEEEGAAAKEDALTKEDDDEDEDEDEAIPKPKKIKIVTPSAKNLLSALKIATVNFF
jgi:hypothetical protein